MMGLIYKLDDKNLTDRLIDEYLVLKSRLILLEDLLKKDTFMEFSFIYRLYLKRQYNAMKKYFKYLKKRMDYLNIDKDIIDTYISTEKAKAEILKKQLNRIEEDLKKKSKKETKSKKSKKNVESKED